jgi:hypothetical protein
VAKDFPAQLGRAPQYDNPQGLLPFPNPNLLDFPVTVWDQLHARLVWRQEAPSPVEPEGVVYTSRWTTPAFDLRPDLRSGLGGPLNGVPSWNKDTRLFIQLKVSSQSQGVQPALTPSAPGLQVFAQNFVHPTFNYPGVATPGEGFTDGTYLTREPQRDVSLAFSGIGTGTGTTAARSKLVGFSPPGSNLGGGEGYPIRYWRLELAFRILIRVDPVPDPPPSPPPLILISGLY